MPEDVEASTAIPTYITFFDRLHSYSKNSEKMLVDSRYGHKQMDKSYLQFFKKEAIKNFPVPMATLIRNFVISKAEDFLKSVVIIDTPGIDPADVRGFDYDASITKESIDLAHYVFWVMDLADGDLVRDSLD